MSDAKVYDPDQMVFSLAGIRFEGFADGDMVTVEFDNDAYTDVVGTDGEVVRSKNADRRATVTVRTMNTSITNVALTALHKKDLSSPGGAGIGVFQAVDLQGFTKMRSEKAWIAAPPKMPFGPGGQALEWKIRCANLQGDFGGE